MVPVFEQDQRCETKIRIELGLLTFTSTTIPKPHPQWGRAKQGNASGTSTSALWAPFDANYPSQDSNRIHRTLKNWRPSGGTARKPTNSRRVAME